MKDSEGIVLFIIGLTFMVLLAYGVLWGIKASFKPQPKVEKLDSRTLQQNQRQLADKALEDQRRKMQEYKQKARDYRNRNLR